MKTVGNEKKINSDGITLVALVITIIILIILATVAISFVFGSNGLIKRAEDASGMYANDTAYTEGSITNVESYINDLLIGAGESTQEPTEPDEPQTPSEEPVKVEEVKGGEAFAEKTTIEDAEGNKVVVPAGFKIASDSGNTVQQGIVIEDVNASTDTAVQGSQFVWIPIGVFIKDGGTPSNEIILGRYTFGTDAQGTPTLQQAAYTEENPENYKTRKLINSYFYEYYGEHRDGVESDISNGINATASNLEAWINSAKENGGYYIGRYEGSFASGTSRDNYKIASKKSTGFALDAMSYTQGRLWNVTNEIEASKVSINSYKDSTSIKSDLINSYAWDTAIVFIQECGHTNYANKKGKDINANLTNTGTGQDEVCKINDMASNLLEFTTEYSNYYLSNRIYPCTYRGGQYNSNIHYTSYRYFHPAASTNVGAGSRMTLYFEKNETT